ncbi:MAG: DNA-protecting protein DprA [Candidatus Yanofskybacteria bacterium]|nr:DNA-protecting protein DprA [Candidatus Yanofskybacteria bacterium]
MQLKYINALNILVSAQTGSLKKISDYFHGNFEHAWHSPVLKSFLPKDAPDKSKIDPEKEFQKLERDSIYLVTLKDKIYPKLLKNIFDPPFLLYIKGDGKILNNNCFAIVGTRALTDYGKRVTPVIAGKIAENGLTIVSGLAMGIDGLAHRAAVERNALTIAVLGGGINGQSIVYENKKLAVEIIKKGGAIISEYPLTAHGNKYSFPQRNRIISGLSKGVLVIEADEKSGSLITAKSALDQGRDVFAVPGPIFSSKSRGPNYLIQNGAKLVTCADDILTEYDIQHSLTKLQLKPKNEAEKNILEIIGEKTMGLDDIIRASKRPAGEIVSCLMDMELEDKIKNLGNNRFSLSS